MPTARAFVCTTAEEVAAALDEFGAPYVVKDDGLAAGKGVVVTEDRQAAVDHAAGCEQVVVEEYLDGPEVSLFALCSWNEADGATVYPLQPAQDFKRIRDARPGPEHRRHGCLHAAAVGARGAGRRGAAHRAAADGRRDGPPRHAVHRAAVRRPGADLEGRAGRGVQRPLRRPRDPAAARAARLLAGGAAPRRRDRHPGRRTRRRPGSRARPSRWSWPAGATRRARRRAR